MLCPLVTGSTRTVWRGHRGWGFGVRRLGNVSTDLGSEGKGSNPIVGGEIVEKEVLRKEGTCRGFSWRGKGTGPSVLPENSRIVC